MAENKGIKRTPFPFLVAYPVFIYFIIFLIIPILYLVFLSLSKTNYFTGASTFSGIENYAKLLDDAIFLKAFKQTFLLAAFRIAIIIPLSLLVALGINRVRSSKLRTFYTLAYFSPIITSTTAVALVWMWIYDPSVGFANYIFSLVGIPRQAFLQDTAIALYSIAAVSIWKDVGWYMVIFHAGVQGIPGHLYEAAEIDGASDWSKFWKITLPLLRPTFLLNMVVVTINSIREFTSIFVMTRATISGEPGGPANSTLTMSVYMFKNAFLYNDYGKAAAIALILLVIIGVFTLIQFRALKSDWEY